MICRKPSSADPATCEIASKAPRKNRRIAVIEEPDAALGAFRDEFDEFRLAEPLELGASGQDRIAQLHAAIESLRLGFGPKIVLSVRAEWMSLRKSVAPERVSDIQSD